jgi:hypothetical protein
MNGRNTVFDRCSMLLPKRMLFRTEHTGRTNRITLFLL